MSLPRWSVFALSVAGLAACGDDGGSNPPIDAPRPIDGRVIDAANPDAAEIDATVPDAATPDAATPDAATPDAATPDAASPDAAAPPDAATPDAPPAPMNTTVWVFGDVATNNVGQVGFFAHPQAATVTPTFVPATGQTPVNNFPTPFSIATDGTRIAYVSGASGTGPWSLSIANADGTGAVEVFAAPATSIITDVALSPDKTKIAFRADLELAGMFDVYVVSAAAAQTPVKVSPDRATNDVALDAQAFLAWSANSRFLAFGGAFTVAGENEVRIRDTMANTTATALGDAAIMAPDAPRGLLIAPQWTASNTLVFAARVSVAGERQLYTANADGTGFAVLPNSVITRADTMMSQANTFALSPDGTQIAFAADGVVATAFEVYVMPATGATAPTRLTSGTIAAGRGLDAFRTPRWNPAGTAIAFGADYGATDDKFQPYVLPLAGGTLRRLAILGTDTDAARDVQNLAWTHDGAFVYAIADGGATDNDFEVYALDASMTDQTPALRVDPPASGDAFDVVTRFVP
jgi:Tol biopolymer transport system component